MGAKEGNENAKKKTGIRVPVVLSISNDKKHPRLAWIREQVKRQNNNQEPTQAEIIRYVKNLCYEHIDNEISRISQKSPENT